MRRSWRPMRTDYRASHRLESGLLLAHLHAVWRITEVVNASLSGDDREKWVAAGMPDPDTWPGRPVTVAVEWVGGAPPPWAGKSDKKSGVLHVPADRRLLWDVYEGGRWPKCSCCGEPMPCRAELEDEQITASLDRIAKLEAIPPGACWSCSEPITQRQKAITYPGENLLLPGGPPVAFHTRRQCVQGAWDYEEKWVAADPRRERILTWPLCNGILVVHGDGSSECVAGRTPLIGDVREGQPDCRGHLTHDHRVMRACYVQEDYLGPERWQGRCPRGCDPKNHPGTTTTPRPEHRQPSTGGLFEEGATQ